MWVDRESECTHTHTQTHTHTSTHAHKHTTTCAEKLVNLGADLNVRNQLGSTALHYAAIEGHTVRVCGLGFRV